MFQFEFHHCSYLKLKLLWCNCSLTNVNIYFVVYQYRHLVKKYQMYPFKIFCKTVIMFWTPLKFVLEPHPFLSNSSSYRRHSSHPGYRKSICLHQVFRRKIVAKIKSCQHRVGCFLLVTASQGDNRENFLF